MDIFIWGCNLGKTGKENTCDDNMYLYTYRKFFNIYTHGSLYKCISLHNVLTSFWEIMLMTGIHMVRNQLFVFIYITMPTKIKF